VVAAAKLKTAPHSNEETRFIIPPNIEISAQTGHNSRGFATHGGVNPRQHGPAESFDENNEQ
jgi:hypothetical protein